MGFDTAADGSGYLAFRFQSRDELNGIAMSNKSRRPLIFRNLRDLIRIKRFCFVKPGTHTPKLSGMKYLGRHRCDVEIELRCTRTPGNVEMWMQFIVNEREREGEHLNGDPLPPHLRGRSTKRKTPSLNSWRPVHFLKRGNAEFTVFDIPPAPSGNIPGPVQPMIYRST